MVCLHTDTMGVHPACILFDGQGYSPPRPGIPPETTPPILHILPLIAHQLASARKTCGINLSLASLGLCARTCERYHGLFSPGSRPTASIQTLSASPTGLRARWAC